MNKYQEAYNTIYEIMAYYQGRKSNIVAIRLFKELVDKATPKKPNIENIHYICCPNCGSDEIELYDYYKDEVKLKHCNKCGQALDWRKDE